MNEASIATGLLILTAILASIWMIYPKVQQFFMDNIKQKSQLDKNLTDQFKNIGERLNQLHLSLEKRPAHNTSFYFNSKGEAMNLNIERWGLELEQDQRQIIKNEKIGMLTTYLRKGGIIFDKFVMDFNKLPNNHPDFPVIQHAIKLMKSSQLNYSQLQFELSVEFVEGVHNRGSLYHHEVFNLIIYQLIKHVRPLYEASLPKKEEEKLAPEELSQKEENTEGQPTLTLMQKAEEKSEGLSLGGQDKG
jgi:hypothetical protein